MSNEKVMDLMSLVDQRGELAAAWLSEAIEDRAALRKRLMRLHGHATPAELSALAAARASIDEWGNAILIVLEELVGEEEDAET